WRFTARPAVLLAKPLSGSFPAWNGHAPDGETLIVVSGDSPTTFHLRASPDVALLPDLVSPDPAPFGSEPDSMLLEFHTEKDLASAIVRETTALRLPIANGRALPLALRTRPGHPIHPVSGRDVA